MSIPVVLDRSYKAGVVYGLQTASFNALRQARRYYKESKLYPEGSIRRNVLLGMVTASNRISMQNRDASRDLWTKNRAIIVSMT